MGQVDLRACRNPNAVAFGKGRGRALSGPESALGSASAERPSAGLRTQHFSDLLRERIDGERLGHHGHVRPEDVVGGEAFGIAGGEEHF